MGASTSFEPPHSSCGGFPVRLHLPLPVITFLNSGLLRKDSSWHGHQRPLLGVRAWHNYPADHDDSRGQRFLVLPVTSIFSLLTELSLLLFLF